MGRSVLEEFLCERGPDMLIGDAVIATRVLELFEVILNCMRRDLHSGRM